ncbi:MAG: S-layer homology domain-containing protein [Clostridiales bacterium]|nr:S-layer homology domain-containing protein [Clostridiales bacterium]
MKRFLSALICLSLLFSFCSPIAEAAPQSGAVTTVIACSDFQNENGNEEGKDFVKGLVEVIKEQTGIDSADGFLCCGDYDYDLYQADVVGETAKGVAALKEAVSGIVTENLVFTQGNHDSGIGSAGMAGSGNNDPASGAYGVFVINEDDYMWWNNNPETIKETAWNLKKYLDQKREDSYTKPIFVLSHLPLNYNMRTVNDGDGQCANYIFDVLNEAGAAGLNIFFLFGHDHSNGWDDYLGGSSIYLAKGDKILIAQDSRTVFKEETLQFTYMNAGYVGYYRDVNQGADDALTMTVFQISEDQVTVARYDANGRHDLKSVGVTNSYKNETAYPPNTRRYSSPQTVKLTKTVTPLPPEPQKEDPCYTRVTNLSDLVDGGKYVLICRPDNMAKYYFMLPTVVDREGRVGFDLETASKVDAGSDRIYVDPSSKEWTFTSDSGGWKIGDGTRYAAFTADGDSAKVTLESPGMPMVVGVSGDYYTFGAGGYVLNYNHRELINGYFDYPSLFYIYEFEGYTVRAENGSADLDVAVPGAQVKFTADAAPEGQIFDKWVVELGDVTLSKTDAAQSELTVTMPTGALRLRATYRSATGSDDPAVRPVCESHSYGSWTSVAEADCTSAGIRRRVCVICGSAERKWVKPLGHEYSSSWTIDVPATETSAGERSHHCARCGERIDITEIPMIPMALPYSDVKTGDWHYTAVQYVVSHNLFNGVGASRFAPDEAMSRAMLATVLWRMDGKPVVSVSNPFSDVASGTYYTDAVLWAWSDSMFPDTDGLKFLPAGNATREQMAVALYQYSCWKGYDTTKRADLSSFPDGKDVSAYAKEALSWAVAEGLIAGENRGGVLLLNPQGSATRAQVATILMRYQMDIVERQEAALPTK